MERSGSETSRRKGSTHRRGVLVGAAGALAVIVVVTVVAVVASTGRGGGGAAIALAAGDAVPSSYHVTYRVIAGSVTNTEQLWVHRPFEAEDVTIAGDPQAGSGGTGDVLSSVITRLGRQLVRAGGAPTVFEPPATSTPFDVRLDVIAVEALRTKVLRRLGSMVIAGRHCQVYRSAAALSSTVLTGEPTAVDHVDTCVDRDGIILREVRVTHGKTVQERVAVEVATGPAATAGHAFATAGSHLPLAQGGGTVVTVSDDSRPPGMPFYALAEPPAGFVHIGRFAVVPPQTPVAPGQSKAGLVTAVDDVFVRGADALIVEQGQTLGGTPFQVPADGRNVEVGSIGSGTLSLSALSSSLTIVRNKSSFVRVSGTVAPDFLVRVARSLQTQAPGAIHVVPDLTSDGE